MAPPRKLSKAFGLVVRQQRLKQGISQEALAERADIHRNYVGMLERGECAATLDVAGQIADGLGMPIVQMIAQAARAVDSGAAASPRRKKP